MGIGLREEKKTALELLESKKKLISGLEGKVEGVRSDGSRLVSDRDRLQTKIDLFDEVLEAERLAAAKTELESNKEAIRQNADLLEATEKALEKERANIQELGERVAGIEGKIRLAIADREAGVAREAAHVVNRALIAYQLAGAFTTYEEFFTRMFFINSSDRSAMRNEFESEACQK